MAVRARRQQGVQSRRGRRTHAGRGSYPHTRRAPAPDHGTRQLHHAQWLVGLRDRVHSGRRNRAEMAQNGGDADPRRSGPRSQGNRHSANVRRQDPRTVLAGIRAVRRAPDHLPRQPAVVPHRRASRHARRRGNGPANRRRESPHPAFRSGRLCLRLLCQRPARGHARRRLPAVRRRYFGIYRP